VHELGSVLALAAALVAAPYQCGSEADPALAMEETPAEALYQLAQELKGQGNEEGWRLTLERIVTRYPSSRFAATAKQDLADAGIHPADPPSSPAAAPRE
jgi:outer membrane protein assembly factor BamD (BamD/ComL family)